MIGEKNMSKELTVFKEEAIKSKFEKLRFQFGTSSCEGIRKLPYVFTEQGVVNILSALTNDMTIKQSF